MELIDYFWSNGDLYRFLRGAEEHPKTFIDKIIFASLSSCDIRFCVHSFKELLEQWSRSADAEAPNIVNKVKIGLAIAYFEAGAIDHCIQSLNQVDLNRLGSFSGVNGEFYKSAHFHLGKLVNLRATALRQGISHNSDKYKHILLGDSHVLSAGWSEFSGLLKHRYIPGVQLSHLASRVNNIFKTGFEAGFASSFSSKFVVISVGEIDYRVSRTRRLDRDYRSYTQTVADIEAVLHTQKKVVEAAIKFITSLARPDQRLFFIGLPGPNPFLMDAFDLSARECEFEEQLIFRLNDFIDGFCKEFDIVFIPRAVNDVNLATSNERLYLDKKHFRPEIYEDMFSHILKGNEEYLL